MRGFGGMVSFRVKAGEQAALDICSNTTLFTLGESLGGVESLIEHPGRMTHASVSGSPLEVPSDLVRLSVGIEEADDLLADLKKALGNVYQLETVASGIAIESAVRQVSPEQVLSCLSCADKLRRRSGSAVLTRFTIS